MTKFIISRAKNAKNDILSGITVALALVPEAFDKGLAEYKF